MHSEWRSASRDHPCPICNSPNADHKSKYCIAKRDGAVAICHFIGEGAKKYIENCGYLHILKADSPSTSENGAESFRSNKKARQRRAVDWIALQKFYRGRANLDEVMVLAGDLGVTSESLHRLRIGFQNSDTYTFPMHDERGKIIGIRKRSSTGKTAVLGSRNGMFLPNFKYAPSGPVVICEGPTDTAMALDLGYPAIGRASCNTCEAMIEKLMSGRRAIIMADNDETGIHYANKLAIRIRAEVILPARGKDLRQWNPSRLEFDKVIGAA